MKPSAFAFTHLAAACTLALSFNALAAPPSLATAAPGASPRQHLQALRTEVQRLHQQAQQAGALDNTPPVLERFSILGDVNVQAALPAAVADLSVVDDLSGLYGYSVTLVGPSGQMVSRSQGVETAQLRLEGSFAIGAAVASYAPFTRYTEPGEWRVDSVYFYDNNYNGVYLSGDDLAAYGQTTFTVVNKFGYDAVPPRLLRGEILTPQVSLSTPPAGTYEGRLPLVSASVKISDSGNGVIAGVNEVMLAFCLLNQYHDCVDRIELHGQADNPGAALATVQLGAELRADQMPGDYFLYQAYVTDVGNNYHHFYSSELGGETNFRKFFSNTHIVVSD